MGLKTRESRSKWDALSVPWVLCHACTPVQLVHQCTTHTGVVLCACARGFGPSFGAFFGALGLPALFAQRFEMDSLHCRTCSRRTEMWVVRTVSAVALVSLIAVMLV